MEQPNGNAAQYFVDRHCDGRIAAKPAFIEVDLTTESQRRHITYGALAAQSDCMASLYKQHGLRREERAAMLVLDCIEFPVIFWGSLKAGIIPVPINTLLPAEIYQNILIDSRARALFISAALFADVAPILAACPDLQCVFIVGEKLSEIVTIEGLVIKSFAKVLAACLPYPCLNVSADDDAFWLYSSGSTGQPKGVRHVHGNLRATSDSYGQKILCITQEDTIFSAAKLFFAYGLGNAMTFPMAVGASIVLLAERPTPESVFAVMAATQPTLFAGVPTLYAALLAALDKPGNGQEEGNKHKGFARLRCCISAGEALPEEIGKRWQRLTGIDILDGVGSTEMLHIFLSNAPNFVVYGTSGVAVPGYELRLVDESGAEIGVGEIGELLVKGESSADSYWNQRAKSRATFEGCWTRTGDKYERRADGRYVYCGRTDDMFKVSGIWVSPFEVEQALITHPSILEAAVVAARDTDGLEKPKAFIVLKPGETPPDNLVENLKQQVKQQIGNWKYPRWIELLDSLPKTATGKIQRFKLRTKA